MKWIDDIVYGLIETYNTNDIYTLYDKLDINIWKMKSDNKMLDGNDAIYMRCLFKEEIVYLSRGLDERYELFVLGHELGHAIMHTEIYEAAFNKDLINQGKMERQANYFALKLLNIELDPVVMKGFNIEQIAKYLHIPVECVDLI